eukprot:SAG22_NODE_238_length_14184_cov_5.966844_9_plen_67_part_01
MATGMAAVFTCRRDFYETDSHAVLTVFAKGVPDEDHVEVALEGGGGTSSSSSSRLTGELTVPGRGVC